MGAGGCAGTGANVCASRTTGAAAAAGGSVDSTRLTDSLRCTISCVGIDVVSAIGVCFPCSMVSCVAASARGTSM